MRRVHVAGVHDPAECRLLIESGVDAIGIPLVLDHHREDLTLDEARELVSCFHRQVAFFLITYLDRAKAIAALCRRLGVRTVQLHGPVEPQELRVLRAAEPRLSIGKSLIVRDDNLDELLVQMRLAEHDADWFVTDTFDPSTGASGATGVRHDWRISRRLVASARRPVVLAGGLDADNVGEAVRTVRPDGVDAHTGLEGPDGLKRAVLVRRFVEVAREAFTCWPPESRGDGSQA